MSDIHYSPEDYGVRVVDEFDLSSGSYEFYYVTVWQSLSDKRVFYIGTDSGCSCPIPYEGTTPETLDRLNPDNPKPQINSYFNLDGVNYNHSTAALIDAIEGMATKVQDAQKEQGDTK